MRIENSQLKEPCRVVPPFVFPYFVKSVEYEYDFVVMFVSKFAGIVVDVGRSGFGIGEYRDNWESINDGVWTPCDIGYSITFTQDL